MVTEYTIAAPDNLSLYCVEEVEQPGQAQATVVVVHGTCEHTGRYNRLSQALAQAGYRVIRYDQRGFGRSGGKRAWVSSWRDYLDDLHLVLTDAHARHPHEQVVLMGHSMGSMVTFNYGIEHPGECAAQVVSGFATRSDLIGFHFDEDEVDEEGYVDSPLDGGMCALPEGEQPYYCIDPYIEHRISTDYFYQVHEGTLFTAQNIADFRDPLLILHGQEDDMVADNNALACYAQIASPVKGLRVYEGVGHDVFRGQYRTRAFQDVIYFLGILLQQ